MATTYTSILSLTDSLNSGAIFRALQREVDIIKQMHVYMDPYQAAYLIKWEIETPDYSFVKEDF